MRYVVAVMVMVMAGSAASVADDLPDHCNKEFVYAILNITERACPKSRLTFEGHRLKEALSSYGVNAACKSAAESKVQDDMRTLRAWCLVYPMMLNQGRDKALVAER